MDKRAIIIGATSGLGLETARLLHRDGWTVGLMGRRGERLAAIAEEFKERETAEESSCRVFTKVVDIRDAEADKRLLELIGEMGGVELVFHVSGIGKQNMALEPDIELATAETNVLGFTRMVTAAFNYFAGLGDGAAENCEAVARQRRERSGNGGKLPPSRGGQGRDCHIAVLSSIAGTKGLGAAPAYSATKRFQNTYIQCLAQQARMRGLDIAFTDIRPGFVDTDLLKGGSYPMLMRPEKVARQIVKAIYKKKRTAVIDRRYALLTFLWRLIPGWLWERMRIRN